MSATTQQYLYITDITDDLVILKDGGAALILQTNALNFGLLSEPEQGAIVATFAQMLNSLSFMIQIVIHSQRLDISSYITLLDKAMKAQTNPLLSSMMARYRDFIRATIKENEVLDKQFYVVISVSSLELGILPSNKEQKLVKIKAVLNPRRDQIVRQLQRIGLTVSQLTTEDLVKNFFSIYNQVESEVLPQVSEVKLTNPKLPAPAAAIAAPIQPTLPPQPQRMPTPQPTSYQPQASSTNRHHPFVVEELVDTI